MFSGSATVSGSGSAINIPFSFVGCSSSSLSAAPSSSSLLSKGGSALSVLCPGRSQRVLCLLRLSRPCRLTRLIVRNAGSVFVAVRCAGVEEAALLEASTAGQLTAKSVAALAGWAELVPEHQLCAADVWRQHGLAQPLPPTLLRVHTFPSAGPMQGSFSPQLLDRLTAAVCVEVRGAEDEWSREARIGLSWLELFGVPLPAVHTSSQH